MYRSESVSQEYAAGFLAATSSEWYPLQVRYQCEKRVDGSLRAEGFDSFAPMWRQTRRWSDRTKVVDAPLFPGYTFVRMEALPELLVKVLRIPGMVRFVTSGRDLVPIATAEIEAIRALMQSEPACAPGPFPAVGEKIRIRGGCLEGMEGILTADTGKGEIVISVGIIQRSIKVPLGAYQVERLSA
jgi:transcription antitermination factor NusG